MPNVGVSLPYPYFEGDYAPDTFEDVTSKNVQFLAGKLGGSAQMRFLHGVVDSSGNFVSGTLGWTSAKTATGTYQIIFDSQFASAPTAHVTAITGVANCLATPSQLDVTTFNIGGGASDQPFNFTVLL